MNAAACLSLCTMLLLSAKAQPKEMDLFELIRKGEITATAKGLGGHEGDCVSLCFTNRTGSPVLVEVKPGSLLVSEDSSLQNLMIVRREQVLLAAHGKGTVDCRAFCVESSDSAPGIDDRFTAVGMAAAPLVRLAEHVSAEHYNDAAVQQAVWVLSNGQSVAEVVGDEGSSVLPLRKFVAELAGVEVPWYTTMHERPITARQAYSPNPVRVNGGFDFALNTHAMVTIAIRDAQQHTVRVMGNDRNLGPGRYTIEIDLIVRGWPGGTYTVDFIQDGSTLLKRLPFSI